MTVLRYTVTLEQPLLITEPAGEPNSSASRPLIPGTMMRGLIAGAYLRASPTDDAALDPTFRRLILDGTTRFLHAYPADSSLRRTIPTPRSLMVGKRDTSDTRTNYDTAHTEFDADKRSEVEDDHGQLMPLGAPFVRLGDEAIATISPTITVAVHIARDRQKGRALAGSGDIFRYEALAAGQVFIGFILCQDSDVAAIRELIPLRATLGRSRGAGYGSVQIKVDAEQSTWCEMASSLISLSKDTEARLLLLSDALLSDEHGVPLLNLDSASLSQILGAPVSLIAERSFSSTTVIGGFNRAWGMPLPQTPALAAGSLFTLTLGDGWDDDRVARLEETGLGDRRAEGYGRVKLLTEASKYDFATSTSERPKLTPVSNLSPLSQGVVARLRQRRFAAQIEQQMTQTARLRGIESERPISNAQLSRVRNLIRQYLASGDKEAVENAFNKIKPAGSDQFEQTRMQSGETLKHWIEELLTCPATVWDSAHLNFESDAIAQRTVVAGSRIEPDPDSDLTKKTALRLIDAVLSAARKKQRGANDE